MNIQITYNKESQEARVNVKGTKMKCTVLCESRKDAKLIATQSLAHKEYLEYLAKKEQPTFAEYKVMDMSNAWKFWNCGIRKIVFRANMIFGMALNDAINLANLVFEGKSIEYMTMDLPYELIQDIKEVERIAIRGRVC